jgi:hypothetical protein
MSTHNAYIMEEVLAKVMKIADPDEGMYKFTTRFEGEEAILGLKVVK